MVCSMTAYWEWALGGVITSGVMVLGAAMGVFGAMMKGELQKVPGERFLLWALVVTVRDVLFVLGGLMTLGSVMGVAVFERKMLFVVLAPAGGLIVLAVGAGRLFKRMEV